MVRFHQYVGHPVVNRSREGEPWFSLIRLIKGVRGVQVVFIIVVQCIVDKVLEQLFKIIVILCLVILHK